MEQDFRFYPTDCTAIQRLRRKLVRSRLPARRVQPLQRTAEELNNPTPELRDLLAYVTAARRWVNDACPQGHHNLMWMSWEPWLSKSDTKHYHWEPHPGERRENVPGTGNYLWFITARGARHIKSTVLVGPACLDIDARRSLSRCREGSTRPPGWK